MANELDLQERRRRFQTPGVICKHCKAALAVVNDPALFPISSGSLSHLHARRQLRQERDCAGRSAAPSEASPSVN